MRDANSRLPVVAAAALLALVLIAATWAFGGYDGLGVAGGLGVTFGILVVAAVGAVLMAVILRGRRSRRDEAVRRMTGRGR